MRPLIVLLLCLLVAIPSFAAITAATVWELHQGSSDLNGGGFDATIAGAGTDLSPFDNKNAAACGSCQSATVNISTTDAVTAGTTTITSATANFSSAIVGNTIYVTGGTGAVVAQRYQVVTFTNSTTIVVDRSTGLTAGTGTTMNIGGALGTPTESESARGVVAGNFVYIKANGVYTSGANINFNTAGSSGLPIIYIGFTSTRTDAGRATIRASANGLNLISGSGNFRRYYNLDIDCNSQTTTRGVNTTGTQVVWSNTIFEKCTSSAMSSGVGQVEVRNSVFKSNTTSAALVVSGTGDVFIGNRFTANTAVAGISDTSNSTTNINTYLFNVIDNNTGATTDGYAKTANGSAVFVGNVVYKNGRDGIRLGAAGAADFMVIVNNIVYGNGVSAAGVGIDSTTTNWSASNLKLDIDYNALACNNSASVCDNAADRTNVAVGAHDVALSADPLTAGGSNDFSLTNTAGGGASCRAAGFPGVLQSGGTGKIDIGALQHTDAGGGGGQKSCASAQ